MLPNAVHACFLRTFRILLLLTSIMFSSEYVTVVFATYLGSEARNNSAGRAP